MPFKPKAHIIYNDFSEIKAEVLRSDIKVLYKYRDWENPFHKKMLVENEIWLANPNEFNDLYDVHIPFEFDRKEIEDPRFIEKIKVNFNRWDGIDITSRECVVRSENLLDQIREDPKWFEKTRLALREDREFDSIGIFSTALYCTENIMWGYYSNSHMGFCLGFEYYGLMELLQTLAQPVQYVEENLKYSFLNDNPFMDSLMFIKQDKWKHEREYRFASLDIPGDAQRSIKFNPSILHHVIFGHKMPNNFQKEIINILQIKYNSRPRLFKTKPDPTNYELVTEEILYR